MTFDPFTDRIPETLYKKLHCIPEKVKSKNNSNLRINHISECFNVNISEENISSFKIVYNNWALNDCSLK